MDDVTSNFSVEVSQVANKLDIKMQLPNDSELDKMFNMVPKLERYKVLDKATGEAAKIVVKRARDLAPKSSETGSALKRSASQANKANWHVPLWKTIKKVFRKYQNRYGIAVIGPEWPTGNKAYFNTSPKGRRQVLWGKPTGRVVAQIRNWIVQAFDETKGQQLDAMKESIKSTVDQVMRAN